MTDNTQPQSTQSSQATSQAVDLQNEPPVIDLRMLDQQGQSSAQSLQAPDVTVGSGTNNEKPSTPVLLTQTGPNVDNIQKPVVGQDQPVNANAETTSVAGSSQGDGQSVAIGGHQYTLPPLVIEKFPDLGQLIMETESMNDQEREYWFQILPVMNEPQIKKFRDILVNEKEQLARLDKEYEQELNKLNDKHMLEWKAFETNEKRKALQTAEAQANASESSEEEELLKRLSQV